jgi:hypothetical protein
MWWLRCERYQKSQPWGKNTRARSMLRPLHLKTEPRSEDGSLARAALVCDMARRVA